MTAAWFSVALLGFGLASFGICWAWTNITWFAPTYDTDERVFRIVRVVQMIRVPRMPVSSYTANIPILR